MTFLKRYLTTGCISLVAHFFTFGQSVNDIFTDVNLNDIPLLSYQVGDSTYTSLCKNSPIKINVEAIPYNHGYKALITFENVSGDEVKLHNVVPMGRSSEHVYITGQGNHGLSRTYLFRPQYKPVNVIVPDNAWELGFSVRTNKVGKNIVSLTRRDRKSITGGRVTRFENYLKPSGKVSFTMWLDYYEGEWQEGLKLMFQERFLYDVEPGTFDNSIFEREDLKWMRDCYSMNQMMTWDKRYFDYTDGTFHYLEHLEKMKKLMVVNIRLLNYLLLIINSYIWKLIHMDM